ncbi:MAG: acetate--CoA ligase family protein [Desulfobacterales bacterium]|nr:MAG: acetate--CoA ligase family protein [Desulfobacterales bacterium]
MKTSSQAALQKLFYPKSVAVAGASANPQNLGSRSLKLIKDFGFKGNLWAVNPKGASSGGVPGYKHLTDIPGPVDLCLIVVPARAVISTVAECVDKDVPVAQVLTGGVGETGTEGRNTEQAIVEQSAGKTRLVGPNCLGIYSPAGGLTLASTSDRQPGQVAIASQSGGLSIDMILQAKNRGLRLSKLVSIGNCMDLDPVDFLQFFGQDPETRVIGMYIEGLKRGREFFRALQKIARHKSVVVLKGGRTSLGAQSVASHTNSLAGEYAIWRTAVTQAGALLVDNVDSFLAVLTALQTHVPCPAGKSVALVGNGGGATVLATDLLEEKGLTLARLSDHIREEVLSIAMPPGSTVGNPTDTPVGALNTAGGEALGGVIDCLLKDPCVNGAVVHFNLLPFINYQNRREIAEGLSRTLLKAGGGDKPVYVALRSVPDATIEALRQQIMTAADQVKLPCFQSANEALATMAEVYNWAARMQARREPELKEASLPVGVEAIIEQAKNQGLRILPPDSAFRLLELYGIPHPPWRLAQSPSEALAAAAEIGYPVVMKIDSPDIIHKSDAGAVAVGLSDHGAVGRSFDRIKRSALAYNPQAQINGMLIQSMSSNGLQEMICGLKRDPVFGQVLVLGLGGVLVELLQDVSMRLLPISQKDARSMWREINGASLLTGYRGAAKADTSALEDLLLKAGRLGETIPEISEMDLNPVMIRKEGEGLSVVDCRVMLEY